MKKKNIFKLCVPRRRLELGRHEVLEDRRLGVGRADLAYDLVGLNGRIPTDLRAPLLPYLIGLELLAAR